MPSFTPGERIQAQDTCIGKMDPVHLSCPRRGASWSLSLSRPCGFLWLCSFASDLSSWFCSLRLKFFILQGLATTLRPSSVQLDFWKSKGLSPESCAFFLSFPLLPPISPLLLKLLFQKPHSQPVKPRLPVDTLFHFFFLLLSLALRPTAKLSSTPWPCSDPKLLSYLPSFWEIKF